MHPNLSFVVPLHNEESCVEELFSSIKKAALDLKREFEIIFIDDGSTDHTFQLVSGIAAKEPRLRVIKLRRNYGQTAALAAGFQAAHGDIVVTLDGDLQNDPNDVGALLEAMEQGYDIVSGWRIARKDAFWLRVFPSRIANWLISRLTGVYLHDYGCSLKAYRGQMLKSIYFHGDMHRFFPALINSLSGARVMEIPVRHYPRKSGKSKYGIDRVFQVLVDLMMLLLLTRFLRKPIYYFALLSIPFFMLGGALIAFIVVFYSKSTENFMIVPGVSFLILAAGFHFIVQGLLAEYTIATGEQDPRDVLAAEIIELGRNRD